MIYAVSNLRLSDTDAVRTLDAMSGTGQNRAKTGVATVSSEAQFLSSISAISGGAFLTVGSSSRLEKNFVDILKEIKTRYLLTYYPQGEREEGWHDVRVQLRKPTGRSEGSTRLLLHCRTGPGEIDRQHPVVLLP